MSTINQNIPLYLMTDSISSSSGVLNFFTRGSTGDNIISNIFMILDASPLSNSEIPFFINGEYNRREISQSIRLYLCSNPISISDNNLGLYLLGGIGSGILQTSNIPMIISGSGINDNFINKSQSIPFYLGVSPGKTENFLMITHGKDSIENDFSLYIKGIEESLSDSFDMILTGKGSESSNLRLFIRGYQ